MRSIRFALLCTGLSLAVLIGVGTNTEAAAPRFAPAMDFGTGCLLGGALNKQFIQTEDAAKMINGGESYKIYSLKGRLGLATGRKPVSIGDPCPEISAVDTTPSYDRQDVVGLGSTWAGMPRVPIALSPNLAVYKNAVADLLKARGITQPHVLIDQIYRIDLEGDGSSEVLISATYFKNGNIPQPVAGPSPDASAGDYSIVFMRKVVNGVVKTVVLDENEFTNDAVFVAPYQYRLRGVMDINGDGNLEVLVMGRYYEGQFTSVFQITGIKAEEVLACGCGA
ncbi:MAG: hypothetical protein ABJA50_01560 [Chloroflexota bacterium]